MTNDTCNLCGKKLMKGEKFIDVMRAWRFGISYNPKYDRSFIHLNCLLKKLDNTLKEDKEDV